MRHLIVLVLCFFSVSVCHAQYEHTSWQQRMGTGKDSVENMKALMVWTPASNANGQNAAAESNAISNALLLGEEAPKPFGEEYPRTWNDSCYRAWRILVDGAPFCAFSLYEFGNGGDMLRYLLQKEQDQAIKLTYFDDLMYICDFRINNLNALNGLPDYGPAKKSSLADVKTWKAHYYYTEGKNISPKVYDKDSAYHYFVDAMKSVREQTSVSGTEVEPYLIEEYFNSCKDLYVVDTDKYIEQFLQDYLDLSSTCKKLYETANEIADVEKSNQQFNKYFNTSLVVNGLMTESGANDAKSIDKHFKATLEEHREDYDYINRALALMMQFNDLPEMDMKKAVDEYARIAYQNPSSMNYYSAIAYALLMKKEVDELFGDEQKRTELRKSMLDAFNKALSLTKTNKEKAEVSWIIAQSLFRPLDEMLENDRSEVEKWEADQMGVISNCETAINLDPDHYAACASYRIMMTYRRIANAYYKIMREGDINDRKHCLELYKTVIDYGNATVQEAERSYNNKIFEQGGTNMASFQEWAVRDAQQPSTIAQNLSKTISNYDAQIKKRKTGLTPAQQEQLRKYNEYMARKKAEEDFWKGK